MFQSKEKRELNERLKLLKKHRDDILRREQQELEQYKASQLEKWEYFVIDDVDTEQLNRMGMLAWELVGVTTYQTGGSNPAIGTANYYSHTRYVFKRKLFPLPPDFLHRLASNYDISKIDAEIAQIITQLEGR